MASQSALQDKIISSNKQYKQKKNNKQAKTVKQ